MDAKRIQAAKDALQANGVDNPSNEEIRKFLTLFDQGESIAAIAAAIVALRGLK